MRFLNVLTTVITIMVVLIALSLVSARFIGAGSYVIQSGSMEPSYHTGALIFDKKVDVQQLAAGDVITFSIAEDMTATHRIVEVLAGDGNTGAADDDSGTADDDSGTADDEAGATDDEAGTADDEAGTAGEAAGASGGVLRFRTKGDANEEADAEPVDARNVIGTPVFQIPYLGYLINFVKTKPGMIAAGIFILLILFIEVLTGKKRKG